MYARLVMTTLVAAWLAVAAPAQAVTPVLDEAGKLTGATGVIVMGTTYDVTFMDGSCVGLFDGCDAVTDFEFDSDTAANAASAALLDQVFQNGQGGDFDTMPSLTTGCSLDTGPNPYCYAYTPYDVAGETVYTVVAENRLVEGNDRVLTSSFDRSNDDFDAPDTVNTWAVWTPHVEQTPRALLNVLVNTVLVLNPKAGVKNALDHKLLNALDALDRVQVNDNASAAGILYAFIQSVEAQRGKALTEEQADQLVAAAQAIIDLLSQP